MKRISRTTTLLPLLMAALSMQVLAQPQPVIVRLKGVGVGSSVNGYGTDVQVVGNLAYLAWSFEWGGDTNHPGGMEIYSLTNPTAPVRVGGCESGAPANAVFVSGHYAYLAEGMVRNFTNDPGVFEIIDVSDPANPVPVGGISTLGRASEIRVAGNFAYVAESKRWTGSNLLGALEIFDVSTPTNPIRVAVFDTAGSATSLDVSGNHVYLADGVTDLQVLDVSNPANPLRVGVFNSDTTHNACGFEPGGPATIVQVVGNLAYSAGDNGLHVLDISNPALPVSISDSYCFPAIYFHVSGPLAFVTFWSSTGNKWLFNVVDLSDLTNPVTVGRADNLGGNMVVVGNLIYFPHHPLWVYEISHRPAITSLSLNFDSLRLTWDYAPGFVLQRSTSLAEPLWSDVPGSQGQTSIQLPMTSGNEFFRLAGP